MAENETNNKVILENKHDNWTKLCRSPITLPAINNCRGSICFWGSFRSTLQLGSALVN